MLASKFCFLHMLTFLFSHNAETELLQTNAAKPKQTKTEQKKNGKPIKKGLALSRLFKTSIHIWIWAHGSSFRREGRGYCGGSSDSPLFVWDR